MTKETAGKRPPPNKGRLQTSLKIKTDQDPPSTGAQRAKKAHQWRARKNALMRLSSRLALPMILLLAVGSYGSLWFSGATLLKDLVQRMSGTLHGGDGWTVAADKPEIGGFPLSVQAVLHNVEIVAPARWGGWTWRTDTLSVSVDPWNLHEPRLNLADHSQIRTADGRLYDVSTQNCVLTLSLSTKDTSKEGHKIKGLDANIIDTTVQPADDALSVQPPLHITSLQLSAHSTPLSPGVGGGSHSESGTVSLSMSKVVLPTLPVGPMVQRLDLKGRLMGALGDGSLREQLTKWRDEGGVAELDHFYLEWSPLKMAATGTLALDARMQPVGALSAQIQGFFETTDTLYKARIMRARDASLARIVLGAMAESKDGVPTLTTPLSVQSGKVILGPVTVMKIPKIQWPGPQASQTEPSLRPAYEVDRWGNIVHQR